MSAKILLVGSLGVVTAAAVGSACFLVPQPFVSANPVVTVDAEAPAPVAIAQLDVRRPREATPGPPRLELPPVYIDSEPTAAPQPRRTSTGFVPDPHDPFGAPQLPAAFPIPDSLAPFGTPQPVLNPAVEAPVDAAAVDPAPLRRELMQLLGEKSDLLTVPQLQAAIVRTEREIRELKAHDRLERLRHELEILSRDYPDTWGGDAARNLFQTPLPTVPNESATPSRLAPQWRPDAQNTDAPTFTPISPTPMRRKSS